MAIPRRLRRAFYDLRTEGSGVGRETAAIGVGVFIGCLPFYGFHLLICWAAGWLLGLNRLKMYLAANVSNPLMAPWLIFAELQAGAWLRRGEFQALTLQAVKNAGAVALGIDVVAGSVIVGGALAVLAAAGTYATLRGSPADPRFVDIIRVVADRYVDTSITAWEFARGKLRADPVYRAAVAGGLLPTGGTLLDVGCGQGLTLAMLADSVRAYEAGTWPARWPPPPRFDRLVGVELRHRVASIARKALGRDAEIIEQDARVDSPGPTRAALFFDVLHLMPPRDQESLVAAVASSLADDGVILVREADASAGRGFAAVRIGNQFKAFATGNWGQTFHFRTKDEWIDCFARLGLRADVQNMGEGTPFANVMFRVKKRS